MAETGDSTISSPDSSTRHIVLSTVLQDMNEPKHAYTEEPNQALLEKARRLGEDRKRFWNMLVTTVNRTGFQPPEGRSTSILALGCGNLLREGLPLESFFGGENFGHHSKNVEIYGVDINSRAIDEARSEAKILDASTYKYVSLPNYHFTVGDATNLKEYPELPQKADVVFIGHQQISSDYSEDDPNAINHGTWQKIFAEGITRLTDTGIMIITSHDEWEHNLMLQALSTINCDVILNEANPYAMPIPGITSDAKIHDRIAIIRRKNG